MDFPTISCLCPTYGRPRLLANAIACFLKQDYPRNRCRLVILDDLGTLQGLCINDLTVAPGDDMRSDGSPIELEVENVSLWTTNRRYSSLPEKYNALWRLAPPSDIYVVWEDDDCQLPWCLKTHARACEHRGWSYPSNVWSDYGEQLHTEPTGGRFHGCLAVTGKTLIALGGWPNTKRADFDQMLIGRLRETGEPGDPLTFAPKLDDILCEKDDPRAALRAANPVITDGHIANGCIGFPAYIFRWHTGQLHGQSVMKGPDDESWYNCYQPPDASGPHTIVPALDSDSQRFYDLLTA